MKKEDYLLGIFFIIVILAMPLIAAIPVSASVQFFPQSQAATAIQPAAVPTAVPARLAAAPASPTLVPTPGPTAAPQVLTLNQQERLYQASLKYAAATTDQAIALARSLGYVKNDGHPDSMCGPLSIAILRDAKLLNHYIDLHDFWLLNPSADRSVLERTFPAGEFAHYRFQTPLNRFDFKNFPLKAGDFLYLYAGPGGSFEHMLTVDRVDAAGRAYAVTNYRTVQGFLVGEVMLYDPAQPGQGMFYSWTDRHNGKLGLTGFGGFELWRFAAPVIDPNPADEGIAGRIDSIIGKYGGDWHIIVKEVGGRVMYARSADKRISIGAVTNVPVAMLFLRSLELKGVAPAEYADYLSSRGSGRTYEQLLRDMLVNSDDESGARIIHAIRVNRLVIDKNLSGWGLTHTDVDFQASTADELATLFDGLYSGEYVRPEARGLILNWMNEYTAGDDTRIGILRGLIPAGFEIYDTRGTQLQPILVVGDAAIIDAPTPIGRKTFVVAMFGYQSKSAPTNDTKLSQAIEEMSVAIWDFVSRGGFLDDE